MVLLLTCWHLDHQGMNISPQDERPTTFKPVTFCPSLKQAAPNISMEGWIETKIESQIYDMIQKSGQFSVTGLCPLTTPRGKFHTRGARASFLSSAEKCYEMRAKTLAKQIVKNGRECMNERRKWRRGRIGIKPGDLVLIMDTDKRVGWPIGRVEEILIASRDGTVQGMKIAVAGKSIIREFASVLPFVEA